MTEWKSTNPTLSSSQSSIAAMKNFLANGRLTPLDSRCGKISYLWIKFLNNDYIGLAFWWLFQTVHCPKVYRFYEIYHTKCNGENAEYFVFLYMLCYTRISKIWITFLDRVQWASSTFLSAQRWNFTYHTSSLSCPTHGKKFCTIRKDEYALAL